MRGVGRRAWTIGFNSLADAADGRGMSGRPLRWIARAGWLAKIASRRVLPGGKRARRFLPRFKLPRLNPFHGG